MLLMKTFLKLICLGIVSFILFQGSSSSAENQSQIITKHSIREMKDFRDLRPSLQSVTVQKVIDGTTFLGRDNQIYRLSGIDIPKPDHPIGQQAVQALRDLIEGKELKILITKKQDQGRINRMGQIMIHAVTKQNIWVQGFMLENGFARVVLMPSNTEQAIPMLVLEQQARLDKKNFWNLDDTRAITSDEALTRLNSFQIVEGAITSTATVRNQLYLNFGIRGQSDWKKDFTIGITPALRKSLARNKINLMEMQNARVRVRGWIQNYNGAYIELESPFDLEILNEGRAAASGTIQKPTIQKPVIEKPIVKLETNDQETQ
jgi:endonuclease YncB( thermonuclease family)